jgi:hypothetical protein
MTAARVFAAVIVTTTACSSPTTPSMVQVAGSWFGTTNAPSLADAFAISVTISQSGSSLSGTWGTTSSKGTLTGTVTGANVALQMTPSVPPTACTSTVATTVVGNQMTGTITSGPLCLAIVTTPISLTRQ